MSTQLSHAKINLWLRILGKRADDFHEVDTLMAPLSLADEITLEEAPDGRLDLECSDPALPTDARNLAYRAAALLRTRHAPARGARLRIVKRIPLGAGLGGGSANAATVLVGLNRLWRLGLSESTLETLAAEIGSDAPFFIRNRPALCEGRGERLSPVVFPQALPVLLLHFGFGSATVWAYRNLHAGAVGSPEQAAPEAFERARHAFLTGRRDVSLDDLLLNDLEGPVFRKFPILAIAREFLASCPGVRGARMSGSGSTIFALLESTSVAPKVEKRLHAKWGRQIWTWIGATLNS
ncbi:MAG: 4-(cytidine 5'-diphospho)-2-C-methyl-D-erythritol kinase [Verrucomicrobiae bacterium]|nr:4-(cytidine 5'-diphospho)-2-C-methyl-D-erythritol kinase [Verrucomicrobiae bacterium]